MAILFASSFDAGSPFGAWDSIGGAVTTPGRTSNGALLNGPLVKTGSFGSTLYAAGGFNSGGFDGGLEINDESSAFGGKIFATWYGFGGLANLQMGSNWFGITNNLLQFAINQGVWYHMLVKGVITQVITPRDATHSDLQLTVEATLWINNFLIGTVTKSGTRLNMLNTDLPVGAFTVLRIKRPSLGASSIWDDVYLSDANVGDAAVAADDITVTTSASDPEITQSPVEVGMQNPDVTPTITQSPIEVGLAPTAPILLGTCPATKPVLNVFYDDFILVSGGTAPYTWTAITALPPGLSLNSATGELSGTITSPGTYCYTVQITDSSTPMGSVNLMCCVSVAGPSSPCPEPERPC